MEKTKNLKKAAEELMKIEGKVRGEVILNRLEYIRSQKGEESINKIAKELNNLGHPLNIKKIHSLGWYSESLSILIILISQKLFKWGDKEIFAMGNNAPKISFIVKLLMKYFISLEMTFKASPQNWAKHRSVGSISHVKYEKNKNKLTFRINNYKFHPIMCIYLKGYFLAFASLVIRNKEVQVIETKCMFKNDPYHEYLVTWKDK
ncbi:MAG: hypothetical protein ABIG60_05755 [Patescibacteria group bacterium]